MSEKDILNHVIPLAEEGFEVFRIRTKFETLWF